MDVILHLGAHRTASTTLQKTLGANGALLAAHGVKYWGPKVTRTGWFDGLMGGVLSEDLQKVAALRVARRVRLARRDGTQTLFVSEENILGTMRLVLAGGGPYHDAGRRAAAVARAFSAAPLTLAVAIRSPETWWPSVHAFRAAKGQEVPAADLAAVAMQADTWRDVITDLANAVPHARLVVWPHEAMADRPEDVIRHLTGVMPTRLTASPHRNAAHSDMRHLLPVPVRDRLRATYARDLDWLRNGADGLAEFIETGPRCEALAATGKEGRYPYDRYVQDAGRLADTRRERAEGP